MMNSSFVIIKEMREKRSVEMKFIHTADWHIGKKVHGFQLLEEQREVFLQLLAVAEQEQVDGIIIAGDLYDRAVPPSEAVALLNEMLIELNIVHQFPILAVSGNHDSATRLETGGPWYQRMNFHLHTKISQSLEPVVLGDTQFFLLPYFEPIDARLYFKDETLTTHELAMKRVVAEMQAQFDPMMKHVLVAHFFVAGSLRTESETEVTVGGLDQVSAYLFKEFDYVALGHLHDPNALKKETIQYSGTLMKFSVSEATQQKGFKLIEFDKNGTLTTQFYPVAPKRDLRIIEGAFHELISPAYYETQKQEDYIYVKLTDTVMIPDAMNRLREVYPNVLGMERLDRSSLFATLNRSTGERLQKKAPSELFKEYYQEVMGEALSQKQEQLLTDLLQELDHKKGDGE